MKRLSAQKDAVNLSPKRVAILRCVRQFGPCSIKTVTQAIHTNYAAILPDLNYLTREGFLCRARGPGKAHTLTVGYDVLCVRILLLTDNDDAPGDEAAAA